MSELPCIVPPLACIARMRHGLTGLDQSEQLPILPAFSISLEDGRANEYL
jgi:hypothetical protein